MGACATLRKSVLLLWCLLLGFGAEALAWGVSGHTIVARVAEARLSPLARRNVNALLALEGFSKLEEVASWADEVRGTRPGLPLHSVRMPLDHSAYDKNRDCRHNLCAVEAIRQYQDQLNNPDVAGLPQLKALKFLVHLVGDIHQPLHASIDTGQRVVVFKGRKYTLHKIWDTIAIRDLQIDAIEHAEYLVGRKLAFDGSCNAAAWATESRDLARDFIMADIERDTRVEVPMILPRDYSNRIFPIIEQRLHLAGIRLALIFNSRLSAEAEHCCHAHSF